MSTKAKVKAKGSKTSRTALPESYFALVRRFPLVSIHDEAHLVVAQEWLDELLAQDLDAGGHAYLNALADLTAMYEDEHYPLDATAPASDVLGFFMRDRKVTQMQLSGETGIAQSTISALLNGTREPTREQIVKLAEFFGVKPATFLP
jgi:antitoxin component HigA of HigAB toxin-antitoxin module